MEIQNKYTFHENVKNPGDLCLMNMVYLDKRVIDGFEKRGCFNIFTSDSTEFLYAFDDKDVLWRCDSIYCK